MKFFLEFRWCCGAIAATLPPQQVVARPLPSRSRRRSMKVNPSAHRKQALSAISEDSVVSDLGTKKTENRNKEASEKSKSTAIARSSSHCDNYRRGSMLMASPGFPTMPFFF
ncbi:hypothetical protein CsSME_00019469 [Camellia sinensis var. sinensis]